MPLSHENIERAQRGQKALDDYATERGLMDEPRQEQLTDLIADLIHLTDLETDLDWAEAVEWGYAHYTEEADA